MSAIRTIAVGIGLLLSEAAIAQVPGTPPAQRTMIDLSSFKIQPATIVLRHGQPYVLHIVNKARGGHDFVAREFFAAATLSSADRALVSDGRVELAGGQAFDIHLVAPAAGTYQARCSHFMHSALGMKGTISVQ